MSENDYKIRVLLVWLFDVVCLFSYELGLCSVFGIQDELFTLLPYGQVDDI